MPGNAQSIGETIRTNYERLPPFVATPIPIIGDERVNNLGELGTEVLFGAEKYKFILLADEDGDVQNIGIFYAGSMMGQSGDLENPVEVIPIGEQHDFCMEDEAVPRRPNVTYLPGGTISHEQASFTSVLMPDGSVVGILTDNKSTNGTWLKKGLLQNFGKGVAASESTVEIDRRVAINLRQFNFFEQLLKKNFGIGEVNITHGFELMFARTIKWEVDQFFWQEEQSRGFIVGRRANGEVIMIKLEAKGRFSGIRDRANMGRYRAGQSINIETSLDKGKSIDVPRNSFQNFIIRGQGLEITRPNGEVERIEVLDGINPRDGFAATMHFVHDRPNIGVMDIFRYIKAIQSDGFKGTIEQFFKKHPPEMDRDLEIARKALKKKPWHLLRRRI